MMQIEKIVGIISLVLGVPAATATVIFLYTYEPPREIIATALSPFPLIATIEESSMGATTPFLYRVYIRQEAEDVGMDVFQADHVDGLSFKWVAPDHLRICYDEARIFHSRNFFSVQSKGVWVEGKVSLADSAKQCAS